MQDSTGESPLLPVSFDTLILSVKCNILFHEQEILVKVIFILLA